MRPRLGSAPSRSSKRGRSSRPRRGAWHSQATARQWARAYAVGGADAVLNAGSHHHTYSYEVKLAVVKDRLENGLTVREAMIKHKIPSESSVKAWCRQYRESGESALVDKPRGRKPRVKKAE